MSPLKRKGGAGVERPFKTKNKQKRQAYYLKQKKAKDSSKRDERFRRRREEDKNPRLRAERRAQNVPLTIDRKRVWDEFNEEDGDGIGYSVDVERMKRKKTGAEEHEDEDGQRLTESNLKVVEEQEAQNQIEQLDQDSEQSEFGDEDELASIMDEDDSEDEGADVAADDGVSDHTKSKSMGPPPIPDATSDLGSVTSTNLSLVPEHLAAKFPSLFEPLESPKILITTSLNGTAHAQASTLTALFPNATYVPRTRHKYNSHHYSLREISKFATNRSYTTLIVLEEDRKRPSGLVMIHLPSGPTFHFSITSWIDGKKLPGHGNPTEHYPELVLNNFRTPLGLLTAHLFRNMFPSQPELEGRQVVTLHNQRDYIFVRRHRYVFRDKRATEKSVTGTDGKAVKGVEEIRAGLQELGPRFTLKLRRIDKGVQRASGQEWEWKGRMEKQRTKFQL